MCSNVARGTWEHNHFVPDLSSEDRDDNGGPIVGSFMDPLGPRIAGELERSGIRPAGSPIECRIGFELSEAMVTDHRDTGVAR
jgi:hypothetical protein